MTFFVITVSIMAVSILLIYKLCRFFGLELKWISLVLCAILAFVVNGVTIMLSPFLTQDHYVRLAALVLVSAALVTLINEYLLKRDRRTELASAGGPAISIEEPEDTPEEEAQELFAASAGEADLSGLELVVRRSGQAAVRTLILPKGTKLAPGGFLLLEQAADAITAAPTTIFIPVSTVGRAKKDFVTSFFDFFYSGSQRPESARPIGQPVHKRSDARRAYSSSSCQKERPFFV